MLWCAAVLISFASFASARAGDEIVFDLDPARTAIEFSVGSALHTVHGTFRLKTGNIRFDPVTGKAEGAAVIDVASGDSGSPARDRRMLKDILEAQRYPEAVFTPDRVDGHLSPEGPSDLQVHGVFKIHGAEHEIVFQTHVESKGGRLTATLHFVVPYIKWGMKNPSTFILRVSDKVELEIRASGQLHPPNS